MSLQYVEGQPQNEKQDHSCPLCPNPPDDKMITCVDCHKIFHKKCVQVSDDITYKCSQCLTTRPTSPTQSISSHCSSISQDSLSRKIKLQLKRLEEERELNQKYLNKKYQLLEEAEALSESSSVKSQVVNNWLLSSETNTTSRFKSLADSRNIQSTILACESITPQTMVECLPQTFTTAARISSLTTTAVTNSTATITSSGGYQQRMQPTRPNVTTRTYDETPTSLPRYNENHSNINQHYVHHQNLFRSAQQQFIPWNPMSSTSNATNYMPLNAATCPPSFAVPQERLEQSHIHARQSIPKELPTFSGLPEEWPIFSSTYEWSTAACALTDTENLIRIQKALKGEALHSVQHMLIHPSNVAGIMQVLRMLYGQPEKIINSIKNKIKLSPKVDENNLKTLTSFSINVRNLISTINASNLFEEINNSSLLLELTQKLPPSYQMQWANEKQQLIKQNKKANLYEFDKWIFNIGITASSIAVDHSTNKNNKEKMNLHPMQMSTNKRAFVHSHSDSKCIVCGNNDNKCKAVESCPTYLSMDRGEKWGIIRKLNLCKHCLLNHSGRCNNKKKCGKEGCEFFHHSSLHRYSADFNKQSETSNQRMQNKTDMEVVNNSHMVSARDFILFKIIPIKIYGKYKVIETYAFIDEGSSISLMDESLAEELKISGVSHPLCLRWTGGMKRLEDSSQNLKISISGNNQNQYDLNVYTVNSLDLPVQSMDYNLISEKYPHLRQLPVETYTNAVPQLLIGLNHINLGVSRKIREGSPYEPIAAYTKLGWLIYGASEGNKNKGTSFNFHVCECLTNSCEDALENLVKSFYSIESIGISVKDPLIAEDDKKALILLNKFTKQKENCHYEVPLLWKYDNIKLPDSYDMALKRLICLENKLLKNAKLLTIFQETITNYLFKGYIRKLHPSDIGHQSKMVWYLPIFAVFNKNKPGKSRVVWDAAAKSHGVSLNSYLLKGPDLLANLPSVLFKFRQKSVAVTGDIEEMFHQIHIRPEDRDVQRFLWRDCLQNRTPDIYVMDVMIFGATCAPSISQFIKNLNATKYENDFPKAATSIKENHYVDDLLDSVDTPQEAIELISDVSYIHRKAGFNIRNWMSNDKSVLKSSSTTKTLDAKCLNGMEEKQIEKILGVFWEHDTDIITFKISTWIMESDVFSGCKIPTKRQVLRFVMSIYDPLGIIGHIIMYVKVFMQEVWRSKINWDDQIPPDLVPKWMQWVRVLPDIQNIKIPRCYLNIFKNYDAIEVQLHTFVDASKDGYAAVCYFRLKQEDVINCSLVGAKTRVAPLKITSVPRLELMAALIGARFAKFIVSNHSIKVNKRYFWSDSRTVLSWLNSDHRKYSQFVAFRTTEILEHSLIKEWKWIPSKYNVADDATKWPKKIIVSNSNRWFQGPEFLFLPENEWPHMEILPEVTEEDRVYHSLKITKFENVFDVSRFSKWTRLVRTAAYLLRFINNCLKINKQKKELTQVELQNAEKILYMQAQLETYGNEISLLQLNKMIPKNSDIYNKNPYLDDKILRVNSRIDNADVPLSQKRPIILPRKSCITQLILMYYHQKYYHMNHETVINEIRQRYYISKLRGTFNSIIRRCQMCKIKKAIPQNPQMAKLPRARVASYMAPFTHTGVDFFGPFSVTINRHKEKRYGCLFTCLTVRAVHIEVAHSLTTSSCILSIRNFMARRGVPQEFYSDNGTNFVGAERELREALLDVDKDELVKAFTTTVTKWKFNPPASPHMGGAWERLVRSVKTVLYKIMPSRPPSDELLLSMMLEVENIINSRPLAYVPIDAETAEALTPNHFLVGSSSGLKPMSACSDSGVVLRQSWLTSQQYANIFWRKWLREYLPTLTCRTKWHDRPRPLSPGDLVIIVDPSLPRNVWQRGKVLETRLASDGQVRSAKVLTQHGILDRPVVKLAILDVAPQRESGDEQTSCHTAGGMLALSPKSQ